MNASITRRSCLQAAMLLLVVSLAACLKSPEALRPADPVGLNATVTGSYVCLQWQPPAEGAVLEYSLSYVPDGVPRTISKDSVSILLTQLEKGATYAFSLKTRDLNGNLSPGAMITVTVADTASGAATGNAAYKGDITFSTQAELDRFSKTIHRVDGKVTISGATISSLQPLAALDSVKGLEIYFNDTLTTLQGLNKLKYVDGSLYLRENKKLTSLDALAGLESITKDLVVLDHAKLENLAGLSGLRRVDGAVYIGVEGWKAPPKARGNTVLTDFCGLRPLLAVSGLKDSLFIQNNMKNPGRAEIITTCR